jgi:hypothetical protein
MKRLITNNGDFFFNTNVSNEQIRRFVNENLHLFFLNEDWSCWASLENNTICIRGDEDNIEIEIELIIPTI